MSALLIDADGQTGVDDELTSPAVNSAGPEDLDLAFDQRFSGRGVASPAGRLRVKRDIRRVIAEWIVILGLAFSVAMLVRFLAVQTFSIPSRSMTPTLMVRDRLLVEKLSYGYREVKRGEIIVFKVPKTITQYEEHKMEDFVKRVIGLPGETLEIRENIVYINGKKLDEPYLPKGTATSQPQRLVIPIDEYFVMGDNRTDSYDSRFWGTVPRDHIVGRVFYRVFPFSRTGSVR